MSYEVRPVGRSRAEARRAYDRMSAIYDWLTAGEAYLRTRLLNLAAARPGERVLDLATGTGGALRRLAAGAGFVVGLDLSPGMLRRAARKVSESVVPIGLVRADAARVPVAPGVFDLIVVSFALELFEVPEIPAILGECRRVLAPGGRLAVGCLAQRPRRNLAVRLYEGLHDRFPAWLDCRPIPVGRYLTEAGWRFDPAVPGLLWGLPVDLVLAHPL